MEMKLFHLYYMSSDDQDVFPPSLIKIKRKECKNFFNQMFDTKLIADTFFTRFAYLSNLLNEFGWWR